LEKNCEYLHELIERPIDNIIDEFSDSAEFYKYKNELRNYYMITKKVSNNIA
jgi:hypothetical protein